MERNFMRKNRMCTGNTNLIKKVYCRHIEKKQSYIIQITGSLRISTLFLISEMLLKYIIMYLLHIRGVF